MPAQCKGRNDERRDVFSFEVVCYLFLGGLGGGLCAVAGLAGVSVPRECFEAGLPLSYRRLMVPIFATATASLVLGSLFLLAASGNYPALRYLFFEPVWGYLPVGAWAIALGVLLCLVALAFWATASRVRGIWAVRLFHAAVAAIGFVIALYTGLFLSDMRAVSLWNTPLLPALFVLSSLSCGLVLMVAYMEAVGVRASFRSYARTMAKSDAVLVVLEFACAFLLVATLLWPLVSTGTVTAGVRSVLALTVGEYAWIWWMVFVGVGMAGTFAFEFLALRAGEGLPGRLWATLAPCVCVLVGAFALRYCVIMAGSHPVLSL